MDAFALAFSYGIYNVSRKDIIVTSIFVGIFHYFMPLLGNKMGDIIYNYSFISPKYLLFLVFLIISVDMFISFLRNNNDLKPLNMLGILLFSLSVSIDSLSVGIGIRYIYSNIWICVLFFSIISAIFTVFGFILGKKMRKQIGKLSFLIGSLLLFVYSLIVLRG